MERPTFQKAIDSAKSHAREAVGGLALLTLAAVACKGGEGQGVETTPTQPANSPVATKTITSPTEAPTVEPTPTPEPSPTPEGWSEEELAEIDAQISSAVNLVLTLSDELNPESDFFSTVKDQALTAVVDYNHVIETKDYQSILTPLDGFISAGINIGDFACHETYREVEGRTWVELRDLVLNLSSRYENAGYIEEGYTETFKSLFIVPESCTNQIMVASKN